MRTVIDIPDHQLERINLLIEREGISCSAFIQRAVNDYLLRYKANEAGTVFGLWEKHSQKGLHYQEALRSDWD